MSDDQKRVILAVAISALVLVSWQYFFSPKNVPAPVQTVTTSAPLQVAQALPTQPTAAAVAMEPLAAKTLLTLEDGVAKVSISSDFSLLDFSKDSKSAVTYFMPENGKPLFNVTFTKAGAVTPVSLVAKSANLLEDVNLGLTLSLQNGIVVWKVKSAVPTKLSIVFNSQKAIDNPNLLRQFLYYGKSDTRIDLGDDKNGEDIFKWFGVDYNYHLLAFVSDAKQAVKYSVLTSGQFVTEFVAPSTELSGKIIFTKKDYDLLVSYQEQLEMSVDYGFFGILAVPLLRSLQFIYKYMPNYGVAIILITLLIRLLTFPLQYKSFVSMKKMQELQPELTKIREKHKDDPKKAQEETMSLFKKSGTNPLSGCLPLLLQLPVFMAFYSVLQASVEMVNAPFYFWITDLSVKDPYYVLPVLMGASMFFQQWITPAATMDKMQQRIMLFMPLIFAFIMKDLPSGLNLYTFVSIAFGIAQQMLVYKFTK